MRLSFQAPQVSSHLQFGKLGTNLLPRLFLVVKEKMSLGTAGLETRLPNSPFAHVLFYLYSSEMCLGWIAHVHHALPTTWAESTGLWMFQVDRCLSTVTPDSWVEFAPLTVRTREKWWYTSGWSGLKITSPPKLKSCKVRRSLPRPIFQATSPGQFSHANPPYNGEIITCMYQPMKKLDVPYILTLSPSACIYFGCFRCYDQSRGRELFSR